MGLGGLGAGTSLAPSLLGQQPGALGTICGEGRGEPALVTSWSRLFYQAFEAVWRRLESSFWSQKDLKPKPAPTPEFY